jgi:hypothetical protein
MFHANAEDLGSCYDLGYELRNLLKINVLIMEYNGYGRYQEFGKNCCPDQLLLDSEIVYNFLVD